MHLVLRRLQTGQQRDAFGSARREPGDRQRLDVAAKLVDPLLQRLGSTFHPDRFVLEHLEIRLSLEVRVGGGIGTIAGSLDLACRLARGVVAGLCGGIFGSTAATGTATANAATSTSERATEAAGCRPEREHAEKWGRRARG